MGFIMRGWLKTKASTDMWKAALKILHGGFPKSKSILQNYESLSVEKIYEIIGLYNGSLQQKRVNESDTAVFFDDLIGERLAVSNSRSAIIPDLGDFSVSPIVCHSNRLIERIAEGLPIQIDGKPHRTDFIGGYDLLVIIENPATLVLVNHDDYFVCFQKIDSSSHGASCNEK